MARLMLKAGLFIFVLFCLLINHSGAQRVFNPVILDEGLPSTYITDITKDKDGFLWVATRNGLARYDGIHFVPQTELFAHSMNSSINEILYDSLRHTLWVGTEGGLYKLNLQDYTIKDYHFVEFLGSEDYKGVEALEIDEGDLWFSMAAGIAQIHHKNDSMICYPLSQYMAKKLEAEPFRGILDLSNDIIDENILWVSTTNGLIRFHKNEPLYFTYRFAAKEKEAQNYYNQIRSVLPMDDGHLWLGTWSKGLIKFSPDRKEKSHQVIEPAQYQTFMERGVSPPILRINKNTAIVNSVSSCVLNLTSGSLSNCISLKTPLGKRYGFSMNYIDESNRIWATSEYGLHLFDSVSMQFENYQFETEDPFFYINSVFEEIGNNQLLITYDHCEGAYLFDRNTGLTELFRPTTTKFLTENSFKGQGILALPNGQYWVVEKHHIYQVDFQNKQLIPVQLPIDREKAMWTSVAMDRTDLIWLGSNSSGMFMMKPGQEGYAQVIEQENEKSTYGYIDHIFADAENNIWFTSADGLNVYERQSATIIEYRPEKSLGIITNIIQGDDGQIWFGSREHGLYEAKLIDQRIELIQQYHHQQGLTEPGIRSIAFDELQKLWMITPRGIQSYDPIQKMSQIFSTSHGLITYDPRFHRNPSILSGIKLLNNGEMCFAPRGGVSFFKPSALKLNSEIPQPYLYQITSGDSVIIRDQFEKQSAFSIPYSKNELTIECSALAFSQSHLVSFEYRFDDEDWKSMAGGRIQFSRLSPDDYHFSFRVKNAAGISSKIHEIQIEIKPPWWRTWWFTLITALTMAFLISRWLKYRQKKREAKQRQIQEMELVMARLESKALRNQMNPHFLFNIFNNIQELILTGDTDRAYTYTTKFSKLLRMILDNARKEEISIERESEFLGLYLELESLRFDDVFEYQIDIEEGLEFLYIPVFLIQPLVENAIRHGLLPSDHEKKLNIKFFSENDELICTVIDNGIGLPESAQIDEPDDRDHALKIIRKRIATIPSGRFQISNRKDQNGVVAELRIPLVQNMSQNGKKSKKL